MKVTKTIMNSIINCAGAVHRFNAQFGSTARTEDISTLQVKDRKYFDSLGDCVQILMSVPLKTTTATLIRNVQILQDLSCVLAQRDTQGLASYVKVLFFLFPVAIKQQYFKDANTRFCEG